MKKQNIFIRILKFFRLLNDNGDLSLTNILLVAFSIKFLLLPSSDFANMSSVFCALVPILTSAGMYVSKNYMHQSREKFEKTLEKQRTVRVDYPDEN